MPTKKKRAKPKGPKYVWASFISRDEGIAYKKPLLLQRVDVSGGHSVWTDKGENVVATQIGAVVTGAAITFAHPNRLVVMGWIAGVRAHMTVLYKSLHHDILEVKWPPE